MTGSPHQHIDDMTTIHAMYRPRHGLGEAAREVLARGQHAILATTNPDGSVHLARSCTSTTTPASTSRRPRPPARCATSPPARQPRSSSKDPAANGEAWVSGTGSAEVLRDDEAKRLGRLIRARYLTETGQEQLGAVMARYDDVVIAVRPERRMAWDMSAFNATLAEHGVSLGHADTWFR